MSGRDIVKQAIRSVAKTDRRSSADILVDRELACEIAEEALDGLSDKAKVHFALALLMKATDPDAVAALHFAGNQLIELSNIMMREAFERECG